MNILLFGGSGLLGTELQKIDSMLCPQHEQADICSRNFLNAYIGAVRPDIIINAAAITDGREVDKDATEAIRTNIIGSANLAMICIEYGIRLVYISTDYVYGGKKDYPFEESGDINPVNKYAWTKLGGECSTKCVQDHLIIRTSFGASKFPYEYAHTNQWTSKGYVDEIAPMIYKAAVSNYVGTLNIGMPPRTMYEYAIQRNPNVKQSTIPKPISHSLNTSLYKIMI